MRDEAKTGVLVIGHGSRREEANKDVRNVARLIGESGGFPLVEAAFLEIAAPNIDEGFARLVEQGASRIIVHPYFLSPGRHTRGDIPVEVREAASRHPRTSYLITEPLSAHHLVIKASIERIRETGGRKSNPSVSREALRGTVYLVGAGPGDPGLLTIRAHELLQSCDVVAYDYLVNPEILNGASLHAERIDVGKIGGGRRTPQDEINHLLIERARRGERVVRLKGGDPFLFGRGGEEAEALYAAGVPFEVVPGISSALAVPAYAGIPLTHRALSSSIAVLTGSGSGDGAYTERLTSLGAIDTLVILMGIGNLREISRDLIATGRFPETPVAVVRWGTYTGQQTVTGTLQTIAGDVERENLRAPAVIVVGEVVALREKLKWFETSFGVSADQEIELAALAAL